MTGRRNRTAGSAAWALAGMLLLHPAAMAGPDDDKPDFPPFDEVSKGYTKVVTTADEPSFYNLWIREKDAQILAELPRGYEGQKHLIATTIASGHIFAGLQWDMRYVYWKRYDKRLALVEPQIDVRATGDPESVDSVKRIWTDRVIAEVPILCLGPNGQPVIDMDAFMTGNVNEFFGAGFFGGGGGVNARLARIAKAKAFPKNVELALEMPIGNGTLRTFHYSISKVEGTPGYKPREADPRVGYFTVGFSDLGKYSDYDVPVRYITRWPLEKRDPKLKMSPPKNPIIFYVEHTTPVRYRRWIRQGVEYWNRAYEQVGIVGAIEVRYQDKATGEHMDKDPEDIRYNFIRWLNNDVGTAIGPSRPHPETGEILDADIVLTDGWIRHFWYQYNEYIPEVAMEGFSPETIAWLEDRPRWDPRVRLAPPHLRHQILTERMQRLAQLAAGETLPLEPALINNQYGSALAEHLGNATLLCMAADGKARDMALMGMHLDVLGMLDDNGEGNGEGDGGQKKDEQLLDGIPEWFVGPMLADLVAHEVGHTLGLRHNFKASSVYSLQEINSPAFKGVRPHTGSVMDYNPVNINMEDGEVQGDYTMIDIGPYDMWAIEYGYTFDDPKKVLERVAEPELIYGTDEDTGGSDPRARRYDFSRDPLDYAKSRMRLVKYHRDRILDKFVKKGDPWHKARRGYQITLSTQLNAISIAAGWLGGSYTYRDFKGDPGDRVPVEPVSADKQRAALKFVIRNAFYDDAFGLTPELLSHMTVDKRDYNPAEEAWPVHDSILGVQASALTMLMNPTTLKRVYDNEFRTPSEQDQLTLPELLTDIFDAVWSEIAELPEKRYTAREPMISSLRRNLQREHLERLVDLTGPDAGFTAAYKPISNLALAQLRDLKGRIDAVLEHANSKLDPYTQAHLTEASLRIAKVLDAQYIYNTDDFAAARVVLPLFFRSPQDAPEQP